MATDRGGTRGHPGDGGKRSITSFRVFVGLPVTRSFLSIIPPPSPFDGPSSQLCQDLHMRVNMFRLSPSNPSLLPFRHITLPVSTPSYRRLSPPSLIPCFVGREKSTYGDPNDETEWRVRGGTPAATRSNEAPSLSRPPTFSLSFSLFI